MTQNVDASIEEDVVQEGEQIVEPADEPVEEAQETAAEAETGEPVEEQESELDVLSAQLQEAQAQAAEYLDGWQRARAEFANYRRREEQQRQQLRDTIKGQVLGDLLPVMDDLDRAFQAVPADVCETAWVKGLSMVGDKLQSVLSKAGVEALSIQPGDAFDPRFHQAVFHGPSADYGEGQIVEVFQRGYVLGDMVLRPAMVYVSSGTPPVESTPAAEDAPAGRDSPGDGTGDTPADRHSDD